MNVTAIIAAAGAGRRMKSDRPKQLLTLDDTPILIYTVRKFDSCRLIAGAGFSKPVSVVQGGARRQDSVAVAMQHLSPDTTIVAVHDAVRPFVKIDEIEAVIAEAQNSGAAVLAIPIVDTVKQIRKDVIDSTLTREHLVLAQTPQAFRTEVLAEAFERARRDEYYGTDESSLVERLGLPVAVVRGSERNIKITRPDDLNLARFFLQEEQGKP
jgi:2-C-methyl-D-erythritol 4-phosphate cytidylyltransferase